MKYKHLLTYIHSLQWCMTPEAYGAMLSALDGELSEADYELFHHAVKADFENLLTNAGEKVESLSYTYRAGQIGFLLLDGPVVPRANNFGKVSGIVSINGYMSEFNKLDRNPDVNHIVTLFDTPGGSSTGVSEAAAMVRSASTPTTGFVYGMAASAGYWIGAAHDRLVSVDTGIVGSIGTLMSYRNGDKTETIVSKQSPLKNADPNTKEGRVQYQNLVDGLTDIFVNSVARDRGVTVEKVLADFGKGAIVGSGPAFEAGMVDEVMMFSDFRKSLEKSVQNKAVIMQQNKPAIAGKGVQNMSEFEKLMAENPVAKAEYEAALKGKFEAGVLEGKEQERKRIDLAAKVAEPVFAKGSKYPGKSREIALRVFQGSAPVESLEMSMEMWDSFTESRNEKSAQAEGEETGSTAADEPKFGNKEKGVLETDKDVDDRVKILRQAQGLEVE